MSCGVDEYKRIKAIDDVFKLGYKFTIKELLKDTIVFLQKSLVYDFVKVIHIQYCISCCKYTKNI